MKKIDVFELPVFPPADVFPMMSEDELQELAADIRANGLNQPLVVAEIDGDLVLVDGRNRRAACELAKVEPEVRHLNGEDPNAYVLSANVHRRHMTKGQRAMAVAMISPEPEKGGRGKKAVRDEPFHVRRWRRRGRSCGTRAISLRPSWRARPLWTMPIRPLVIARMPPRPRRVGSPTCASAIPNSPTRSSRVI
jgi:ParB-like nuclease domain